VAEGSVDLAILLRRQAQVLVRQEALVARLEALVAQLDPQSATPLALRSVLESESGGPASDE